MNQYFKVVLTGHGVRGHEKRTRRPVHYRISSLIYLFRSEAMMVAKNLGHQTIVRWRDGNLTELPVN